MKVLDHVPSTMETLVKNIFELIDMPEYGYASTSFHQGIDPRTLAVQYLQEFVTIVAE